MISLPNGSVVAIASGYGPVNGITALSNASPTVATISGSPQDVVTGDYVEITSDWQKITDRIVRAGTVSGSTVPLLGLDTTDVTRYPAGSGLGGLRRVAGWTQLAQILGTGSTGGEQQFLEYQLLEASDKRRIPTAKSAAGITFTVADDPTLAGYMLAAAADEDRLPRAVRVTLPSGGVLLYNAIISLGSTPTLVVNEIMSVVVSLSLMAKYVRYAS